MKTIMKTLATGLALMFANAWLSSASAGDVAVGQDAAHVRTALGEPQGYMRIEAHEVWFYPRGRVELQNGVVSDVDLISEEALQERKAEEQETRAANEAARRERAAALQEEGQRVLAQKLADPDFAGLPARTRLAYWQGFQRRYAGVDIHDIYAETLAQTQADGDAANLRTQVADLQQRVAQAEQRAADAETRANQQSDAVQTSGYDTSYPVYEPTVGYASPVIYAPYAVYAPRYGYGYLPVHRFRSGESRAHFDADDRAVRGSREPHHTGAVGSNEHNGTRVIAPEVERMR